MGGDPLDDFAELSAFIERDYVMIASEKQLIAYLRRDHLAGKSGASGANVN
jgi:hypothetical protein